MYSQQSLLQAINNFLNRNLSLKNRSSFVLVFIWIFCLISIEVSLVAAAPCTGTSEDNCLSECNGSCTAVACKRGTEQCKNSTAEEQVLATDTEEPVPPGPVQICEDAIGECKNNTTQAAIPSTETDENISPEQMGECEGELDEFGDCENITTEGDISLAEEEDTTQVSQVVECSEGLYGDNCSLPCPSNCVGPKCDLMTGDCSKGCRIGYQGSQCEETCSLGFFGHECKSNCPSNCATNECHHESGYCLNGCKEDYWGSDCSLAGEFKDNPEATQDNFYQHLSAESKSVLLYMLMSRYEETLEKAQMEVSRSIRLRNKLRVIMGG